MNRKALILLSLFFVIACGQANVVVYYNYNATGDMFNSVKDTFIGVSNPVVGYSFLDVGLLIHNNDSSEFYVFPDAFSIRSPYARYFPMKDYSMERKDVFPGAYSSGYLFFRLPSSECNNLTLEYDNKSVSIIRIYAPPDTMTTGSAFLNLGWIKEVQTAQEWAGW